MPSSGGLTSLPSHGTMRRTVVVPCETTPDWNPDEFSPYLLPRTHRITDHQEPDKIRGHRIKLQHPGRFRHGQRDSLPEAQARGGAAIVTTQGAYPDALGEGKGFRGTMSIAHDRFIPGLAETGCRHKSRRRPIGPANPSLWPGRRSRPGLLSDANGSAPESFPISNLRERLRPRR